MELVARMHKAAAVMQFKLEGQATARNRAWDPDRRRLLHRVDRDANTVEVDGRYHPLHAASAMPTVDPADPYALTSGEQACLDVPRNSFRLDRKLQEHVAFVVADGGMRAVRDGHLIFHGCGPCAADGTFLPMGLPDGRTLAGRPLFDAPDRAVRRAVARPDAAGLDLLWYLWCGPRSPLFGKDRITTSERDFVADAAAHHGSKDPYFALVHEPWFCQRVLTEFGVGDGVGGGDGDGGRGLVVNGHVPVKIDEGEGPAKRSGRAITIDGAFSEAYGDHGYTLVIEADRTLPARHHHFESVDAAIRDGVDIVPTVTTVRREARPRLVSDTERGAELRADVTLLNRLLDAYALRPR